MEPESQPFIVSDEPLHGALKVESAIILKEKWLVGDLLLLGIYTLKLEEEKNGALVKVEMP